MKKRSIRTPLGGLAGDETGTARALFHYLHMHSRFHPAV